MSQVAEHQRAKCPTCHASQGEPCVTRSGRIAEKVHYGRPYWSSKTITNKPRVTPIRTVSPSRPVQCINCDRWSQFDVCPDCQRQE